MRPRLTTATRALYNHMLQFLSSLHSHRLHTKRVRSLFSHFTLFPTKHHFSTATSSTTSLTNASSPSSLTTQNSNTHIDLSSINFTGIAQSVILKCSHFLDKNKGKDFSKASLKDLLLDISDIVPNTSRRLLRVSVLKPEDVLEILLGFQLECENVGIGARKVESLWEIFKWAKGQDNNGFKHLSRSCEVMALLLVRVGMLKEVELLLSTMESQGISLDSHEVFNNLIEGYVSVGELERAILVHDQLRGRGLVPSMMCYRTLLDLLVQKKKIQLAYRVFCDMLEMNVSLSDVEKDGFENVIRLLCSDGKIQERRNLVKKVLAFGLEPSNLVTNEIARGYCNKRDFEDLLSFFAEIKCAPTIIAGNNIIHCLCSNFGTESADLIMQELEDLGFNPDEITFGILIGWSCREGKLKKAFIYLSEMLSRGLKPNVYSYNALISAVFKEGIWKHAQDILDEMVDRGTTPDLSTFKILLAGFCKARQFEEVKRIVCEMASHGFIQLSSVGDPLSEAFLALGLNPLTVRLKRDNDVGFSKAEFFDNLGNGLYLDTDLDEYDKRVAGVLEESMAPDFELLVMEECGHGNLRTALVLVDEMVQWGQELSLSVFSALVKRLSSSRSHIKAATELMEKMPQLANQLDQETLNLLVQAYSRKGLTCNGRIIMDGMLQRYLTIKNETYTALIISLCKKGSTGDLHHWWEIAQNDKWVPSWEGCKALVGCLCQCKMLKEALQLLECMLLSYPHLRSEICYMFLEKLCFTGFARIAHVLLDEFIKQGCILDHMAYSHLVRGLCMEKKFAVAFMMLDNMLAENLAPSFDVSVLLIPQLCRAGRYKKAIALMDIGLREQPSSSFSFHSALINGFCMTGKVGEIRTLFQDMLLKGPFPDAEIYNMLLQGHCLVNNLRNARELLGVIIRKDLILSISSYRNLVRLMCVEGRVFHALSLKELMHGQSESHDLIIYNILIFYLFQTGNSLLIKKILDEFQEKELVPNEATYNFLVYGFSQCKDVSTTLHYLSTMISKELRPSNRNLRTVISSLCNVGELGKALQLSREMELRGWVHGPIIQNAIVEGLLSHGKVEEAENFMDRMVKKGLIPDNINYDNLIKHFCWHGKLNKAVDLLNIMLKKGNLPSSTSYDSVIHGFCTQNRLDQALDFHAEMLISDLKPSIDTWSKLVHDFCQDGRTAEAERFVISMVQGGQNPTREMYCTVINRHRLENNLRKVSELMQIMQQSGYEPDFETHWSLISNLRNSSDKDNYNSNQGFLSRLLSESGFAEKKDSKTKLG